MSESWEPLASREVEPMDALLLRADENPTARSTIVALYVLDDAPSWPRVLRAFDRASRTVPRLRQRVMSPNLPFSLPYWVGDADFDLAYHVRRVRSPGSGTLRELLDLAQVNGTVPLDRARPLWEATLIEGLDLATCGGRAALMIKASHAVGDGLAGVAMVLALFDFEPSPSPTPLPPVPEPDGVVPADLDRLRMQQAPSVSRQRSAANARRTAAAMALALRPKDAVATAGTALRWTRSLTRVLAPGPDPSPVWRGRGQRRRYSVLDVPLAALRQAGKAAGGSLNDAYLAAVLGGVRLYHDKSGSPIETISMAIPVSVRTDDDPAHGNRIAGARFAAPAGEPDPAVRIQLISRLVAAGRAEPALDALRTFAPVFARLPAPLLDELSKRVISHDVQVSNIPGYPVPVYLAGQEVLRFYPFGPVPGVAAMITLASHVGVCYVGVNVDPDAVRDPELFDTCLQQGFAEVLALADGGPVTDVTG